MNSLVVAGILKRFYNHFDMGTFSSRFRLQKIIYLIQSKGICLGYDFSWYLHGPYSVALTRDAYQIEDFSKVKPVGFEDMNIEKKFKEIKEKIDKKDDFWLETASSIHFLKQIYPNKTKEQIIKEVKDKSPVFQEKEGEIEIIWNQIGGWLI